MPNLAAMLRRLSREPAAPDPSGTARTPGAVDLALVGAVWGGTAVEIAATDHRWPAASAALALAAVALPWRRRRPLVVTAVVFGTSLALAVMAWIQGSTWTGPVAGALVLVVPYALARWASGPRAAAGVAIVAVSAAIDFMRQDAPLADVIGGITVVALTLALGGWARSAAAGRRRDLETARITERERLARDLHDTVAHHVSAVLIQAQAGRAVSGHRPEAAGEALASIEAEASRALAEMRSLVRALRHDETGIDTDVGGRGAGSGVGAETGVGVGDAVAPGVADLRPLPGLTELTGLAADGPPAVRVAVHDGIAEATGRTVAGAVFRIAQEAVTNARRHAAGATGIVVAVEPAGDGMLRLTVTDDGAPTGPAVDGFGLTGMRERVALLGGTLRAGPGPGRGWVVRADLPLDGGRGR